MNCLPCKGKRKCPEEEDHMLSEEEPEVEVPSEDEEEELELLEKLLNTLEEMRSLLNNLISQITRL